VRSCTPSIRPATNDNGRTVVLTCKSRSMFRPEIRVEGWVRKGLTYSMASPLTLRPLQA